MLLVPQIMSGYKVETAPILFSFRSGTFSFHHGGRSPTSGEGRGRSRAVCSVAANRLKTRYHRPHAISANQESDNQEFGKSRGFTGAARKYFRLSILFLVELGIVLSTVAIPKLKESTRPLFSHGLRANHCMFA